MAPEYDVQLSTYDIQPGEIRLRAGEPVRLRFVNNSNQGLTFSAGDFFRSAQMRRRDSKLVRGGAIEVPPLSTRTVVLVPKAGRYKATGANYPSTTIRVVPRPTASRQGGQVAAVMLGFRYATLSRLSRIAPRRPCRRPGVADGAGI